MAALPKISPARTRGNQRSAEFDGLKRDGFHEGEVRAQKMRNVGVRGGEFDQQPAQVLVADRVPAVLGGDADGGEAAVLSQATGSKGRTWFDSRSSAPSAMRAKTGWKRADNAA